MQIIVQIHGIGNGTDLSELQSIIRTAVEPVSYRVKQICLYVTDVNGPRGGVDKQCRCVLHRRRLPPVVIRDRDANLFALIHRVADRVSEAVRRRKERDASRPRQAIYRHDQASLPIDSLWKGTTDELPHLQDTVADDGTTRN